MNVMISKTGFNILTGGGFFLFSSFCLFAQETTIPETQPKVVNVSQPPEDTPSTQKVTQLGEVVINTALGFKKTAKSLSYSAQEIKPDELTTVKDANFTNAITGKASNVTITQGSGGVGSATNIILRGNNSLTGSGQPLIVIDGVPTVNYNQRPNTGQAQMGGNYMAPDGLSMINPDDVESLTILKGASAAALYGSQAANGAIIITTKSGKEGRARINVSSNTTFSTPMYTPKMQTTYGGAIGANGVGSWGEKTPNAKNAKNFFKDIMQTGVNTVNAVNFSVGNKMGQVFTSYANTYGKGLLPNNTLNRHNFDIKGDANFFNNFLEVGAKISYTQQVINNPYNPGSYLNPYYNLMGMSADLPLNDYKNYDLGNPTLGFKGQNWVGNPNESGDNPYWILNRVRTSDNLSRVLATANVKLNFTDWLNLMARGTIDKTNQRFQIKMYQGTGTTLAGENGAYQNQTSEATQYYGDVILNFNKDIVKDIFHINAFIGGAIRDYSRTGTIINSGIGRGSKLYVPNVFTESNIDFGANGGSGSISQDPNYDRRQVQSVFYSAEFSYKNALFLTHTGRNDWSSTLPANANSYYYPSIGASAVLTELIKSIQSKTLNYLKVRLSYTQVGNDLPQFVVNPILSIGSQGLSNPSIIVMPGTTLKPELTSSIEAGIDFALFNNLVKFEGTYYKTNTTNQLFRVSAPQSSGFQYYYVNGGNIQNQGVELSLSVSPKFGPVEWTSTINFSKNINKIISLTSGVTEFIYSQLNNSNSYYQKITTGGSLGDIYAKKWIRNPDGSIKIDPIFENGIPTENGTPVAQNDAQKIGSAYPNFLLSWGNSFTYKGFRLSFLIDGRFGGKVISLSQARLDANGNSIASANDRDRGFVDIGGGKTFADVQSFYRTQAGIAGPLGEYAYSGTVIRLRELSLAYSFRSLLQKTKAFQYIKDISVSVIARNLFYFYKAAPIDPEIVSNNIQGQYAFLGVELYNLPATRSFGFGVNFTF